MTAPNLSPLGDSCITLSLGEGISVELSERAVEHAAAVRQAGLAGVTDVVPSYATVTIFYDPRAILYADLRDRLLGVVAGLESPASEIVRTPRQHRIPVTYDGPDLEEVARRTGLTAEEVIRIHSGAEYRVFVIGFVPGFAYLGPLDSRLIIPRRESPRTRVPAGSVAIAEGQTGIYPSATPGGWHLIGTTRTQMFDASRNPPALLAVGDIVTFVAAG
jgi:KipI family sensor histidine kinase inhibitor